ncbi:hypothetical protein AB7M17_007183 [Bradyrhizobium sp. USDA 377]
MNGQQGLSFLGIRVMDAHRRKKAGRPASTSDDRGTVNHANKGLAKSRQITSYRGMNWWYLYGGIGLITTIGAVAGLIFLAHRKRGQREDAVINRQIYDRLDQVDLRRRRDRES